MLPIIVGVKNRSFIPVYVKPVYYLLYVSFAFDTIGILLNQWNINNMVLGYFFTLIEFVFLLLVYKRFFNIGFVPLSVLIAAFMLIVIAESFHIGIYQYNSLSTATESTVFMICSLFAFYIIMKKMLFKNDLLAESFFYVNTAILFYFAGDLFLFVMSSYLQTHSSKQFPQLYLFHSVFHIIYYVLITIAFVKTKKDPAITKRHSIMYN